MVLGLKNGGLRRTRGQLFLSFFFRLLLLSCLGLHSGPFSSILVVYPSLLHTLLAATTFLSAVRDVNRHDSNATYIPRLHMYYYL